MSEQCTEELYGFGSYSRSIWSVHPFHRIPRVHHGSKFNLLGQGTDQIFPDRVVQMVQLSLMLPGTS
ncbi:hypothetical protein M378DRAFT_161959 [Amanita muscaria Koide BX008]|uniref:Uncharacterized protein n=1 Tax=Amanita muscaria (strain Koide BX008) TaxID=946122 RepID=A0A0C2X8L9_AMAMK|nr:hypothetical protein M378DRAFT_161959 [Amanita muscaria Koide BX008]